MTPTDEQLHILSLAARTNQNIMVNALAGSGKSTTLEMIEGVQPDAPVLYLAFNRKIIDDMERRQKDPDNPVRFRPTTMVKTFNSLGHKTWSKACSKTISLDKTKCADILKEIIRSEPNRQTQSMLWAEFWNIISAVQMAKSLGYIPEGHMFAKRSLCTHEALAAALDEPPTELLMSYINTVLLTSIRMAYQGLIDYNDQIYMPTLFAGTFPAFPLVVVDEYQDLNPINHHMIAKLAKHRLIGVGDPFQSIYAFRGADPHGMANAIATYSMTECPLSISFRCPEAIVRSVHWRVPHFRAAKSGGSVIIRAKQNLLDFPDGCAIICRNNGPLFALAMRLLAAGKSVSVAGSEIGPKIVGQMKRLGPPEMKQPDLLGAIDGWEADKIAKGSKTAEDTASCMRVFARHGTNLSTALAYVDHLFRQSGKITLITGHKAKGMEWPAVFHLDPWLIRDDEQDQNLRYVIQTRSSDRYYEITTDTIYQ